MKIHCWYQMKNQNLWRKALFSVWLPCIFTFIGKLKGYVEIKGSIKEHAILQCKFKHVERERSRFPLDSDIKADKNQLKFRHSIANILATYKWEKWEKFTPSVGGEVSAVEQTWLASKDAKSIFWCCDLPQLKYTTTKVHFHVNL